MTIHKKSLPLAAIILVWSLSVHAEEQLCSIVVPLIPSEAEGELLPLSVTVEGRWMGNVRGYTGRTYVFVTVLRDAQGRELCVQMTSAGLGKPNGAPKLDRRRRHSHPGSRGK